MKKFLMDLLGLVPVSELSEEYQRGFYDGKIEGTFWEHASHEDYQRGYNDGHREGYYQGYEEGYEEGFDSELSE